MHILIQTTTMSIVLAAVLAEPLYAAELTKGDLAFQQAIGRPCPVVYLWPGPGPDEVKTFDGEQISPDKNAESIRITNVARPSFTVIAPPGGKNTGAALVLGPGGGYGSLGIQTILETARWMNDRGVTVILLKYRVPKRHQGFAMNHHALQDAQRALGIIRARAGEWGIDPDKIGIGGFSAGGHLATSLCNNHQKRLYEPIDDYDQVSCRPDYAVLLYPAYLTNPILSRTPDPGLHFEQISVDVTPPTFIGITMPDKFTIGSVEYYLALRKAKVNAELHVYPSGGHGGAISKYPFGEWADECRRWMGDLGLVPQSPRPEAFTYKAPHLPEVPAEQGLTEGDQKLRQILGRNCPVVPLWPVGTGPDEPKEWGEEKVSHKSRKGTALNITNVSRPTLTVVPPEEKKATGTAVVVCPGGGYGGLAAEHEGVTVVEWLNRQGITGILLKYRVPRRGNPYPKHHHALQDIQRAMRIVRARAEEWDIDPFKVGVCGFSAGGHLCATLCANFDEPAYDPVDEIDRRDSRPDFALLIYPAYLTDPIESDNVDPLVINGLERNKTPLLFCAIAVKNDRFARGALNYYLRVREAKVPSELHVYAGGGHGGGIDPVSYPTSEWPRACARWLKDLDAELDVIKQKRLKPTK